MGRVSNRVAGGGGPAPERTKAFRLRSMRGVVGDLASFVFASRQSPIMRFLAWLMSSSTWWHVFGFGGVLVLSSLAREVFSAGASEGRLSLCVVAVGVACANGVAFASYRSQWKALIGEKGLMPAKQLKEPPFPWPVVVGRTGEVQGGTRGLQRYFNVMVGLPSE